MTQPQRISRGPRIVAWTVLGLGAASLMLILWVGFGVARTLDTGQDLSDFETPGAARAFVSARLPAPLPGNATVEQLHYDHWADWMLTARVRFADVKSAEQYLEDAKRLRSLRDEYCYHEEPPDGARYFLPASFACGTLVRRSALELGVECNTR